MKNDWKESQAVRKQRVQGSRKMGTMVERTHKEEMNSSRGNWRDMLEDEYWEDEIPEDDNQKLDKD